MIIRKAEFRDLDSIVRLVDDDFTKLGYGFVNKAQIETEIVKKRVVVAEDGETIIGVRIGLSTLWNIVVARESRGKGIGKALIEYARPLMIRVKSDPIGHLSNEQRESFVDPTAFYEKLGYQLWGLSFPKNFWQKGIGGMGQFHMKGSKAHIKIYKDSTAMRI